MDGDRSRECPHSGREITDGCLRAGDAHSGGEVTGGAGEARATHAGGEISVEMTAADVASLTAREVTLRRGAGRTNVRVDITADVGGAGVNGCGLQQESSFEFSLSKRLRAGTNPSQQLSCWQLSR
jgi:hypothetical protein